MADDVYWLDVSSDYEDTSNWSTGSVPADGDNVFFLNGSKSLTLNVDRSGDADTDTPAKVVIGRGFRGTIGSAASPLKYAALTTLIVDNETPGQIHVAASGTIAEARILNTGVGIYACHLAAGTVTKMYAVRARHLRLGGPLAVGLLEASYATRPASDVTIVIEAGEGAITNALQSGGVIHSYRAVATKLRMTGGQWWAIGEGSAYGTVELSGQATLYAHDDGSSWTLVDIAGPQAVWTSADDPDPKTITNATVRTGGKLLAANQADNIVFTNPPVVIGGVVTGTDSISGIVELNALMF